ncbi:MAG: hypothetical protein I3J02_05665 [Prevotella sp.]|nr:hypothetical protein [Prevotella sp.]
MNRYLTAAVLLSLCAQSAVAQSGTNSPYSQFGLGILADQSSGFNRGMNGLGLGFHEGNQINYQNPASYSAIDSLSFIFDAGVAGQVTNFKDGNNKLNANNANFDYVVAGFRAFKHVGVSFGLVPFTNIGYSYSTTTDVNDVNSTVATNTYSGSGGIHQVYLGVGWEPLHGLSIGVNGSYLYGAYTRTLLSSYSDSYANSLTKRYTADVRNYKVDFGAQYTVRLSKKDAVTLGVTYGLGHKIGGSPKLEIVSTNSQTSVSDTTTYEGTAGSKLNLEIPTTIAAGFMYNHANQIKLGVDYSLQKWASVESPEYVSNADNTISYVMKSGVYKDRHKITVGADFCPQELSRSFIKRIHYRVGVAYATPYYYINGQDGPKEMSASLGFGIPIINSYNNRSLLNISAQWIRQSTKNYITDNTFRITIGLTFNERWFAKWKVD